jgi:hypothetical protein
MRNLAVLSETGRLPTGWPKPAVDDLMSVAAHGLISTDRGRAAWLIERINGRPRARRAYRTGPLQLDLFDVSRHQG